MKTIFLILISATLLFSQIDKHKSVIARMNVVAGNVYEWEIDSLLVYHPTLADSITTDYNNFVSNLKDSATTIMGYSVTSLSQIWDVMVIMAAPDTSVGHHDITNNGFNGIDISETVPVFTAFEGIAGAGNAELYSTQWSPNPDSIKFQQDSASISVYSRVELKVSNIIIGDGGAGNVVQLSPNRGDAAFRGKMNSLVMHPAFESTNSSLGMFTISRWAVDAVGGFWNFSEGDSVQTAIASGTVASTSLLLLSPSGGLAFQVSFYAIGIGIPYAMHRALTNCFETFIMDHWGKGIIP